MATNRTIRRLQVVGPEEIAKIYQIEARELGARLRMARTLRGWTLSEAAERCDLDLKHLQKIEAGRINVTLRSLVRIASGFSVTVATLFSSGFAARPPP